MARDVAVRGTTSPTAPDLRAYDVIGSRWGELWSELWSALRSELERRS